MLSPEYDVAGSVRDGQALLETAAATQSDVLVPDNCMPVVRVLEAASELKRAGSKGRIVCLTIHDRAYFVRAARNVGGRLGFVIKARMTTGKRLAIKQALKGRRFTSLVDQLDA